MLFKVQVVLPGKRKQPAMVFTRCVQPESFSLTSTAKLGGSAIRPFISKPRALDAEGKPDDSVFAFTLVDRRDAGKFSAGAVVELEP